MNELDRVIATNICPLFLFTCTVVFCVIANLFEGPYVKVILYVSASLLFLFNIKVIAKLATRKRIYNILVGRVESNGFSTNIFVGKCPTICSLVMCMYIFIRCKSFSDIPFLIRQFNSRKSLALHPDLKIEQAINDAIFKS